MLIPLLTCSGYTDIHRRQSETDSLYHETDLGGDQNVDISTQRTIDSGVASFLDGELNSCTADDDECILIDDCDCHEEIVADEGVDCTDICVDFIIPKEEPVDAIAMDNAIAITEESLVGIESTGALALPETEVLPQETKSLESNDSSVVNKDTENEEVTYSCLVMYITLFFVFFQDYRKFITRRVILPPSRLKDYDLPVKVTILNVPNYINSLQGKAFNPEILYENSAMYIL